MNQPLKRPAMAFLRWSVGLVVLWQSYQTFHMAYTKGHAPGHAGALTGVRLVLSGSEIVAAILFLAPSSEANYRFPPRAISTARRTACALFTVS